MITTVSSLFGYKSIHQEESERYGDAVIDFETINEKIRQLPPPPAKRTSTRSCGEVAYSPSRLYFTTEFIDSMSIQINYPGLESDTLEKRVNQPY